MSLAKLARQAQISRQSLYNMFGSVPVFNTSFVKILQVLGVSFQDLTEEASQGEQLIAQAPTTVRRIVVTLMEFCRTCDASLLLFGSRLRGKTGPQVDWDFAIWFQQTIPEQVFRTCKQQVQETAFPYRVDLVNLNHAPPWFRQEVDQSHIVLCGAYP